MIHRVFLPNPINVRGRSNAYRHPSAAHTSMRSSWFSRLLALFLIVPLAELALLIWIGDRVGLWPTVGLVVATALVGTWLAKREGWGAFNRLQRKMAEGGIPGKELTDGLIILISGVLLLTPGILTDIVGLLGLVPRTRALIRKSLQRRFARAMERGNASVFVMPPSDAFNQPHTPIEDAEVIEEG